MIRCHMRSLGALSCPPTPRSCYPRSCLTSMPSFILARSLTLTTSLSCTICSRHSNLNSQDNGTSEPSCAFTSSSSMAYTIRGKPKVQKEICKTPFWHQSSLMWELSISTCLRMRSTGSFLKIKFRKTSRSL